jgi:hypothetical protein
VARSLPARLRRRREELRFRPGSSVKERPIAQWTIQLDLCCVVDRAVLTAAFRRAHDDGQDHAVRLLDGLDAIQRLTRIRLVVNRQRPSVVRYPTRLPPRRACHAVGDEPHRHEENDEGHQDPCTEETETPPRQTHLGTHGSPPPPYRKPFRSSTVVDVNAEPASRRRAAIWGTYSHRHGGVDIIGTRDAIRDLAGELASGRSGYVAFSQPPAEKLGRERQALDGLRFEQTDNPTDLIVLRRDGAVVFLSGGRASIASALAGGLSNLADSPYRVTEASVPTHVHFEPTVGAPYSPESTVEIAFHLAPE